jgi:hypothetical protein
MPKTNNFLTVGFLEKHPFGEPPLMDSGCYTPVASGFEVYSYTWDWGNHAEITNFDVDTQKIDLQAFWSNFSDFTIYDNELGHAVIDLTAINNSTITINNINTQALTDAHFIGVNGRLHEALHAPAPHPALSEIITPFDDLTISSGAHSFTWNSGEHPIIAHFDLKNDLIDLSTFYASFDKINIYNNLSGDAVIDLSALNNQSITLIGISAESLSAQHIVGVSGDLSSAINRAPLETDDKPSPSTPENVDIFSFTWNWGSHDIIEDFNPDQDVIDLSNFHISNPEALEIYNDHNGNTVIDLMDINHQTITLDNVMADDLSDGNIVI